MTDRPSGPRGPLPDGRLVHSRVVADPGEALSAALDRGLTGYAVLEPGDALLLDAAAGVIVFRRGVPTAAYHAGTGRGGPEALADLAVPGPYSADLYGTDPETAAVLAEDPDLRILPGMAARRLAGAPDLADRTREVAAAELGWRGRTDGSSAVRGSAAGPESVARDPLAGETAGEAGTPDRGGSDERPKPADPDPREAGGADAVAAFLEDEGKIQAIRERAAEQARQRAEEWGLSDQLEE